MKLQPLPVGMLPLAAAIRAQGIEPVQITREGTRLIWYFPPQPAVRQTVAHYNSGELSVSLFRFLSSFEKCRDEVRGR